MQQFIIFLLLGVAALTGPFPCKAAVKAGNPDGKGFPTADAAAQALVDAAKADNVQELIAILGPSSKDIVTTQDPVEDRNVRRAFVARTADRFRVVASRGKPNEKRLLAGKDDWPLPIPIVEVNGKWYFDMARGKKQILIRRVGSNELDAIEVCRGYVEAQHQYGEQHHTPEGAPYYAQKIISSPGQRDGLYWEGQDSEESPIGEIVAKAIAEGYTDKTKAYHGYHYKVLTAQGANPSGVATNYVDDGAMTKGFALIAWPAQYGSTGIMTFVVNKSGIVYQKNLGPQTGKVAAAYQEYDPDATWKPVSSGVASLTAR